jgi:hypothetical protein
LVAGAGFEPTTFVAIKSEPRAKLGKHIKCR